MFYDIYEPLNIESYKRRLSDIKNYPNIYQVCSNFLYITITQSSLSLYIGSASN